ncbi:acyltransferase family protein [Bacillus sp. 2205SS5-2]|uniref:acyltransferase family protein n=1 Tax=Bacillus sp. 2205SS5-2 TaxID=3109031 RepID=UPI003006DE05
MESTHKPLHKKRRVYSLDMLRGIIVILSVFLSNIPNGIYNFTYFRHAEWYGVTLIDLILPIFITIFGTSMAIAYQKGVKWSKILKRTVRLIIYGLLFTIIVSWSVDISTLRFTGVLQMFAFLGIATVLITKIVQSPVKLILIAVTLTSVYGLGLLTLSADCSDDLPQPSCNAPYSIDENIFGKAHLYHQGERGFDPEGLVTSFSALANVLIGYAIGKLILTRKETGAWKELISLGVILLLISFLWDQFLPFNKRIWTPAFGLLAASCTSIMLSILYLLFDKRKVDAKETFLKPVVWFLEAFGRNSFLIYFGKFIIASVLLHITITVGQEEKALSKILFHSIDSAVPYAQLVYAIIMLLFWTVIALIAHKKKWYFKV